MANRYWVGGTGNWSDTAHWSVNSDGTGSGASIPASADRVYFNQYSFTATGQTTTVNVTAHCLDMDWTGTLYNPTVKGNYSIWFNGNVVLSPNMASALDQGFEFTGTSPKTFISAGKQIRALALSGNGGSLTIQDALTCITGITVSSGSLITNNKNIISAELYISGTQTRMLDLGSSTVTCTGAFNASTSTGLIFNSKTSTIRITGNSKTFAGGGVAFNNVEFQGTPTTITGSNTFNELKVASGKTLNITSGTTQTVTKLSADSATIQSTTAGTPATILSAEEQVVRTATIKDITAVGTFYALRNSVNVSGNTGITFTDKILRGLVAVKGATGSYTSADGKTVTVANGLITNITT